MRAPRRVRRVPGRWNSAPQAEPQRIDAVVVEAPGEPAGAAALRAPLVGVGQQPVADRGAQPRRGVAKVGLVLLVGGLAVARAGPEAQRVGRGVGRGAGGGCQSRRGGEQQGGEDQGRQSHDGSRIRPGKGSPAPGLASAVPRAGPANAAAPAPSPRPRRRRDTGCGGGATGPRLNDARSRTCASCDAGWCGRSPARRRPG